MLVVGGGLAGISAAAALADAGWRVTLVEARPRLGGAAYSFLRDGMPVDTGAHVLLRCYTDYLSLLRRMGVDGLVAVQPRMTIPVMRHGCPPTVLRRGRRGPAPLHLLPALLRYAALTPLDKVAVARAAAAFRRVDPDDPRWDLVPFGEWLTSQRQSAAAVDALWALLCVAALNIDPAQASMALMARVIRTGLLDGVDHGDIAVPAAPLSDLHDGPARALLVRLGVRVLTGQRVTGMSRREPTSGATARYAVRTAATEYLCDAVVLAVPHRQAATLVPAEAAPARADWARLDHSPIVNVHLRYDRVVTGRALQPAGFCAVLGGPLPWLFDRTGAAGCTGQYLVASISAADADIGRPAADLVAEATRALADLFPAAGSARPVDAFVTREPHATFRQAAGSGRYRPTAGTAWPGLALAGAWTATGWPDTLEGAVRSGRRAAAAVVEGIRQTDARTVIVDDREPEVAR